MDKHAEHFVETFVKELEEENVAIFAGAGLSVGAGYVDWKKLLQPIAQDLKLDIDQQHDLISIAQYHLNEKQNRSGLNRVLIGQHVHSNSIEPFASSQMHSSTETYSVDAETISA
jgi:hypothetical protein